MISGDELEAAVMELIINAGESKSCAMEALNAAKAGKWDDVDSLMASSLAASKAAHKVQTALIGMDEGEGKVPVNLIMVHAQDHIMTAMLAKDMIEEFINIHRLLQAK